MNLNINGRSFNNQAGLTNGKQAESGQQNIAQGQQMFKAAGGLAAAELARMNAGDGFNIPSNQTNSNGGALTMGDNGQGMIGQQAINQNQVMIGFSGGPTTYIQGRTPPPPPPPPVTPPPVTQPPVTQPPVTQPPVTQPPVTQPPVITTGPPQVDPGFTWPCVDPSTGQAVYTHIEYDRNTAFVPDTQNNKMYFNIQEFTDLASTKFGGFPPGGQAGVASLIQSGELKQIPTGANGLPELGRPPDPAIAGVDYTFA